MAANGQMVTNTVTITWDGVSQRIPRGTIIDTAAPSGSNLANTIGAGNLTALTAQQQSGNPGIFQTPVRPNLTLFNPGQN